MHIARPDVLPVVLLLAGVVGISNSHAQALPTATKMADVSVFGGYTPYTYSDFGSGTHTGFMGGADYTVFPKWFFDPSVETRFTFARSTEVTEKSYLIGPRLQKDLMHDRLHPYVNFLAGRGSFNYHEPSGTGVDSGKVFSYGGGVDFDINRHWSARFDLQQQEWSMAKNTFFKPNGENFTLSPRSYTFGVTYHFSFSGLNKQKELK